MMFRFNFLCGMRCINFCYLQVKDVLNEDNSVKDIIELTPDKNNYITSLLTNGIDITTVKTLVNHSNIQTTAIYYNENENMLKNVVNQLHI